MRGWPRRVPPPPRNCGGAEAYADSVATYLGLSVSRQANRLSNLTFWDSGRATVQQVFARHALQMVWDFCEANPFSDSSGSFWGQIGYITKVIGAAPTSKTSSTIIQQDAAENVPLVQGAVAATDPPYYDNIGYADLSDFFYVWLRRTLRDVHPDLFQTLLTPKARELVATPHRFGGDRNEARAFFETGLGRATANMCAGQAGGYPMTLFYAYKQAETEADDRGNGTTASTGWETMLSGLLESGFAITGTWPVRSELTTALKKNTNALASSIVLACRPRPADAPTVRRRDFAAALKGELPAAIRRLQAENIAPVDLAQAAIGPGMAVFSRYARVLEANGAAMGVRDALGEINRVLDETLAEAEGDLDADTRFCVTWFAQYGTNERPYGEAEVLFTATNTSSAGLERAGVIRSGGGRVRLKRRDELAADWHPAQDNRITDWECAQHLVRTMTTGGGAVEAARLAAAMEPARAARAHALAYRLYTVAERRGWSEEALAYNIFITSWPQIQTEMARLSDDGAQGELALEQE